MHKNRGQQMLPAFIILFSAHSFQHTGGIFAPTVLYHVLALPHDAHSLAIAPVIIVAVQIIRHDAQLTALLGNRIATANGFQCFQ